jgi:hypothetical protein
MKAKVSKNSMAVGKLIGKGRISGMFAFWNATSGQTVGNEWPPVLASASVLVLVN